MSRPLLALLVATVAFFALWLVALKPGSSSNGGSSQPSLGAYQKDINAAKNVGKVVAGNTARQGAAEAGKSTTATTPASVTHVTTTAPAHSTVRTHAHKAVTPRHAHARPTVPATRVTQPTTANGRLRAVQQALDSHKVLALLFYNPAASDDDAVKRELAGVSTHRGQVVKMIIPLSELPSYTLVISQVPVNYSPTLVIIDRHRQAVEIAGFADSYEIEQQLDAAL